MDSIPEFFNKLGKMSFNHRLLLVLITTLSCSFLSSGQVLINEICSANGDIAYDPDFYDFSGWIELYNSGNSTADISGYFISDDELEIAKWQIPPGTTIAPNQYLIIWCDKKNTGYHTNFSLDSDGEVIIFSNVSQAQVDKITFPKQYTNVSYGRLNNGSSIGYLTLPSLNEANNNSSGTVQLDNPTVSLKSGRYASEQTATITHTIAGAVIWMALSQHIPP
jgi:Lamin Tail Domain